jgi:CRISPR type IV-associated protein Csf1
MKSPSELVLRACGRQPLGDPAKKPGRCAMCGAQHQIGDMVEPFKPLDSFTDWASLRSPESEVVCGWCLAVKGKEFTQTYAKSVVCSEGLFPFAKNDHIAYWLLNPPPGPFLMFAIDQTVQHVIWRTDVSLSPDIYNLRYGEQQFLIRRQKLLSGVEACRQITSILNLGRKKAAINTPFKVLSRDLSSLDHGELRQDVVELAKSDPVVQKAVDELMTLTHGEIWGLNALIYATNPHRPEPVFTPN